MYFNLGLAVQRGMDVVLTYFCLSTFVNSLCRARMTCADAYAHFSCDLFI